MAGLRDPELVENQPATDTDAQPPKPPSAPEVIDLLAALYKRQRQELDLSLTALLQQQQLKGPGTLAEWLNRLTVDPSSPFLKGEAPQLILRANLPGATPIHVEPNRITACHNGEKLTPHTAMAMATLALADPAMREKGIELEGTEEEQILLFMALRLHGYDKILNPPKFDPQNNPKHAELYQQVMQDWPVYVMHTPGAPQPAIAPEAEKKDQPAPVSNDNAPKAEEQKPAEPKAEEPKTEAPKAEQPKAEEPKAAEPKAAEPVAQEQKPAEQPAQPAAPAAAPVTAEQPAKPAKAEEVKSEEIKAEEQAEEQLPPPAQTQGGDKWLHPDLHNKLAEKHGDALIASNPNQPVMPERLVNFWNKRIDDKTKEKYLAELKLDDPFVPSPLAQQRKAAETPEEAIAPPQPEPEEIKPIRELRIEPEAAQAEEVSAEVKEKPAAEKAPAAAPVEAAPIAAPVAVAEKPKRVRKPKKETEAKAEKETTPKRSRKKAPVAAFEQAASETSAVETNTVETNKVETTKVETTIVETTTTETRTPGAPVVKTKVPANIFNTAGSLTLPKQHVFLPETSGWDKLSPAMQDRLQEYVSKIFSETYPGADLPTQADIVAFWDAKQPEERVTLLNGIIENEEKNAAAESQLRALKSEANAAFAGDMVPAAEPAAAAAPGKPRSRKRSAPRTGPAVG